MTVDTRVLDDIVEDLKGQCVHDLEHFCEVYNVDYSALTIEDHCYVDERVFCCERCGWWCDIDELHSVEDHNELFCTECGEGMDC